MSVKVGPSQKEYQVHKGLLCYHSEYFRGAFEGGFQESKDGVANLETENVVVFDAVFRWLYTGKLLDQEYKFDLTQRLSSRLLCETYVFAEARGIPTLKNAIINIMVPLASKQNVVLHEHAEYIYSNTPDNDKLRALLVDLMTRNGAVNTAAYFNDSTKNIYPLAFLFDICKAAVGPANAQKISTEALNRGKVNWCDYHDHTHINAAREPK